MLELVSNIIATIYLFTVSHVCKKKRIEVFNNMLLTKMFDMWKLEESNNVLQINFE